MLMPHDELTASRSSVRSIRKLRLMMGFILSRSWVWSVRRSCGAPDGDVTAFCCNIGHVLSMLLMHCRVAHCTSESFSLQTLGSLPRRKRSGVLWRSGSERAFKEHIWTGMRHRW
jgi:hypothetical protein